MKDEKNQLDIHMKQERRQMIEINEKLRNLEVENQKLKVQAGTRARSKLSYINFYFFFHLKIKNGCLRYFKKTFCK